MSVVLPQLPDDLTDVNALKRFLSAMRQAVSLLQDETKDSVQSASDSIPGIATSEQAIAGTDDATIVSPLKLRNGLNASGNAPIYACRAWVNFNGTTSPIAIRGSGNVSSITDLGVGWYTVNFIIPMPDSNYTFNIETGGSSGAYMHRTIEDEATRTASSLRFATINTSFNYIDPQYVSIIVFR